MTGSPFVDRIRAEAEAEAERIVRDVEKLREEGRGVLGVLRALELEPPEALLALVGPVLEETARVPVRREPAPEPPTTQVPVAPVEPKPELKRATKQRGPAAVSLDKIPVELRDMPAVKHRGANLALTLGAAKAEKAVLEDVRAHPGAIPGEVSARIYGERDNHVFEARVGKYLRSLADEGLVFRTGKNRRKPWQKAGRAGVAYAVDARGPLEEPVPDPVAQPERWATLVARVRDDVVKRTGPFSPRQVAQRLGISLDAAKATFAALERRSVIVARGTDVFEYAPPKDAGAAARVDGERREREAPGRAGGGGSPVPGTGQARRYADKAVQEVVDRARRAGGVDEPTGTGHVRIKNPVNGRSITIASTPRREQTDANLKNLRRIGLSV